MIVFLRFSNQKRWVPSVDKKHLGTAVSSSLFAALGVVVLVIGRSMNLPDAPSQNQNSRSVFSWTSPSDSRTVAGRNNICPLRVLILLPRAAMLHCLKPLAIPVAVAGR